MNEAVKVLVVEDSPDWQQLLTRLIKDAGYEVVAVSNHQEAARQLDSQLFHVAIIAPRLVAEDYDDLSGLQVLKHISDSRQEIPNAIVLTSYGISQTVRTAFREYRAFDVIDKRQLDSRDFLEVLRYAARDALSKISEVLSSFTEEWQDIVGCLESMSHNDFIDATMAIVDRLTSTVGLSPHSEKPIDHQPFVVHLLDVQPLFWVTRLPPVMPILFLQSPKLTNKALDALRFLITKKLKQFGNIGMLVLFSEQHTFASEVELLKTQVSQPYAYDVIPIDFGFLKRLLLSGEPRQVVCRFVLDQVDVASVSPFIITGPAPDSMFFGREKELREIIKHAATASHAVIGGRRIGKTSILKRLERVRLPNAGFRALYHDCSFTPTQAELVQAAAAEKTWFPEPPTSLPASFASVIQALPDDKPLVILLDEADKLIEPDRRSGYPLFNTLRGIANAGRCRFVLSGEQALRTELTNPNSPLFNFANEMLIGCLDFPAVEELVTRPMKQLEIELADEAEIVQHIWDFTSGHPNIVQRLCQRLIVRLNERQGRRLTPSDVEAVVADPDFLRKDFLNVYWERATALERLCSLVMAADDSIRTLTVVHEALASHGIEVTLNQVDDALERLVDLRNILQRTAEGYDFAVTAFPEVIAKTARLDDLIALNRETYQHHGDVEPRSKRGVS